MERIEIEFKGWTICGFRYPDGSRIWASKEGRPGALMYYSEKDSPEMLVE
jgi:hypothetical protein